MYSFNDFHTKKQSTPSEGFKETVYYTNDSAPNKLRDALPPECLSGDYPVALLCRVYDPMDSDCLNDPNFFNDLEVMQHFSHQKVRTSFLI
jgi:hypothetical protein